MKSPFLAMVFCIIVAPFWTATASPDPLSNPVNDAVIGYVLADRVGADAYTANPDFAYNAAGGEIEITRIARGQYQVRFLGLGQDDSGGHVQVTAHGATPEQCMLLGFGTEDDDFWATVRCFDADGNDANEEFSLIVLWPNENIERLAFAWADDEDNDAYSPDPDYAFNSTGGAISITRVSTGRYRVRFEDFGSTVGGHVQITPYGSTVGACKTTGWFLSTDAQVVGVQCYDPSGVETDLRFMVLYAAPFRPVYGMAYAWAQDESSDSYVPESVYAYNSTGGDITAERDGVGIYDMRFDGLGSERVTGGNVQVTAYGTGTAACKARLWEGETRNFRVRVSCHDADGNAIDANYNVLVMWPDAPLPPVSDATLAYVLVDDPESDGYIVENASSFNRADEADIEFARVSAGAYTVTFVDLVGLIEAGANVQVSPVGGAHKCNITGWIQVTDDLEVGVRCYDATGTLTEGQFSVLVIEPDEPNPAIGFVWANNAASDEYSPSPAYAFNGSGGDIVMSRSGPGVYRASFLGLGRGTDGGNVQVSAYGSGSHTCSVDQWSSDTADFIVDIRCYDTDGSPLDARYSALVTWPDVEDTRVSYVWADDDNDDSYTPDEDYAMNGAGDGIEITRQELGRYTVTFENLGNTEPGGNVQVSAYDSPGHCSVGGWDSDTDDFVVNVDCYDAEGNPVDAQYSLLVNWTNRSSGTAVEGRDLPDADFRVVAVYPNPSSGSATIEFLTETGGHTRLELYDISGRRVRQVLDRIQPAGRHIVVIDAVDLPAGSYLARLSVDGRSVVQPLVLIP